MYPFVMASCIIAGTKTETKRKLTQYFKVNALSLIASVCIHIYIWSLKIRVITTDTKRQRTESHTQTSNHIILLIKSMAFKNTLKRLNFGIKL